jgi:succinate dehydrogenase/fumarate reductase flavoprotein subunit
VLVALFLAALMMRVDEGNADGDSQAQVTALLVLVVSAVFVALLFFIIKEVRSELRKDFEAIRESTMAKSRNSQSLDRATNELAPIKLKLAKNVNLTNDSHSVPGAKF